MTKKLSPEQKAAKATAAKLAAMPTGAETNQPGPRSRNSVTVACKLPHGLILRLFDFTEVAVPVLGGGMRMERRSFQVGESVTISGCASPHGESKPLTGGFALTANVDAEFWAKWLKQNPDSDAVKNGLLFAHEKRDNVEGFAHEHRAQKSGLERIDVRPGSKDPRLPKGVKTLSKTDENEEAA